MTPTPTVPATPSPDPGTPGRGWVLAGLLSGVAGLATSQLVSQVLSVRETPLVAVAEGIIRLTPGDVANAAVEVLAMIAKPLLLVVVVGALLACFAVAGALWRRGPWHSLPVWLLLAAAALAAGIWFNGAGTATTLPVVVGFMTWVISMTVVGGALREHEAQRRTAPVDARAPDGTSRRAVLVAFGGVGLVAASAAVVGRLVDLRKAAVLESRRLLRIPGVTQPEVPDRALVGVEGITAWQTPNEDFYTIQTALSIPTVEAKNWQLRIHGMVENELLLTYDDLLARGLTEAWVTLSCVSNEVGGDLVGNAWWSGVLTSDLLAEAVPLPGADAVLQTSVDRWTCSTPLAAMTDDRNALLAVAMNGEPLPIEHGFPARTVVPGLYGYTSACKWVVSWEVTRFSDVEAYWTQNGWAEQAPVRLASRVDVPRDGDDVQAGWLTVGGVAWHQDVGIEWVEVALDGGLWRRATVADPGTDATWVQWTARVEVTPGEHTLRVRAGNRLGEVQTAARRAPLPDGATGWHEVRFNAEEPEEG